MTTRIPFEELPAVVRKRIEECTGPLLKVAPVSEGLNSAIALRVHTENGTFYVKGLRDDHRWVWTQKREADVNPYLAGIAPTLHERIEAAGWDLLIFEALDGHHADYTTGSPDLPKVVDLLTRLGEIRCPQVGLRPVADRLQKYAEHPDDLRYFTGDALLHTDLNNANILVGDERAHAVDWAWASPGAAWLDAGYWVPWLMAAGRHDPASAEQWARKVPAWHTAPAEAITAFARATANVWEEIGSSIDPSPFIARMVVATRQWAKYRGEL